jgi:predicted DNA-binding transcriptional regulator AlpA
MTSKKRQAAQAEASQKAAATKTAHAEKHRAAALCTMPGLLTEKPEAPTVETHAHERDQQHVHGPRGPPGLRLLTKREILDLTGVSFVTIWTWMRAGKFPRSREVGGRSMWFSTEVDDWLNGLPVRKLKGDNGAAISA